MRHARQQIMAAVHVLVYTHTEREREGGEGGRQLLGILF